MDECPISHGYTCKIYRCVQVSSGLKFVAKLIHDDKYKEQSMEIEFMKMINGTKGFPKYIDSGKFIYR
jgi:hypothetical protein